VSETRADPNLASMGAEVAQDVVRLVRAEIDLAKIEMQTALRRLAVAAALIGVALMLLLLAVIEALGSVPAAFSVRLFGNQWLGWLVFGGLLLVLGALVGFVGTMRLRSALRVGKQTMTALKEDSEWLRHLTRRANSGS